MVELEDVKAHLRIDDDASDALLERLIQSATNECAAFLEVEPSNAVLSKPDVVTGIILAVQADYDGSPDRRQLYLSAAHALWRQHAQSMGV